MRGQMPARDWSPGIFPAAPPSSSLRGVTVVSVSRAPFTSRPNNVAARVFEGSVYALSLAEGSAVVHSSE